MMELLELGALTVKFVRFVIEQTTGGALQELGAQFLQVIQARLGRSRRELEEAVKNPQLLDELEAEVVHAASLDSHFKNTLESLMEQLKQEQQNATIFNQTTNSGFNQQINTNLGTAIGQQSIGQQSNFHRQP
jgi:hypothetical protein